MNINTLCHPALATPTATTPASPLPQAGTSARNTQAPHPFVTLMEYAHQATGGHSVPSRLGVEAFRPRPR
jgi:hypothetical protein